MVPLPTSGGDGVMLPASPHTPESGHRAVPVVASLILEAIKSAKEASCFAKHGLEA
jgi:hypothetical protein